jgi:hypothetical protein
MVAMIIIGKKMREEYKEVEGMTVVEEEDMMVV